MSILTQALSLDPIGGIELCTLQDSVALAERGHSIDVMYGSDGSLRDIYTQAGIRTVGPYPFQFDPRRAVTGLIGFVPAARRTRKLRPDVLWLNRPENIIWAQAVSRVPRTPIVCHLHHHPNYNRLPLLYAGVSHFIAVSEYMKGEWADRGLPPERISVLHNAITAEDYPFGGMTEQRAAKQELGLPADAAVVLYYGRIIPEKGLPTLLKAWKESGLTPEQAILVIVGAPAPTEHPEIARELEMLPPDSYRWFPTRSDVVPFLHAADVVVCPFTAPEPFGRVVIEAMATGRPVIASDVGAVSEILSGSMSRLLVPGGAPSVLAERIRSMLNWRRDEPSLGTACREWVTRRFPYRTHVDELENILAAHRRP